MGIAEDVRRGRIAQGEHDVLHAQVTILLRWMVTDVDLRMSINCPEEGDIRHTAVSHAPSTQCRLTVAIANLPSVAINVIILSWQCFEWRQMRITGAGTLNTGELLGW